MAARCFPRRSKHEKSVCAAATASSPRCRWRGWRKGMVRSIAARWAQRLSSGSPSCGPPRSRVTSEALAFYGRHFGALVLTCAIALLPATLLAAGAVRFSLAALGRGEVGEARSHSEQIREKQRELLEKPPASEEARSERVQRLRRAAPAGGAALHARRFLDNVGPIASPTAIFGLLLLAGLLPSQPAAVPPV